MAKKRKVWLHVGVTGAGDVLEAALAHHHDALVELGVASVARTTAEGFCAAVEVMRTHKEWGLRRSDVEGEWARLVRRAEKSRADLAFSQPLLSAATPEQIDLLVDALTGHQVHVVVTTGADDEADTVERWGRAVRKPERLHVIETDGMDQADVWKAFGKLVGFGTASLRLDAVPRPVPACQSLPEAMRELERLARRTASLEVRLEELDRKRRKLKRRLRQAA
ncbi:hypothetical protein [Nocardioides sp. SYSU DS0651]|uniref:hypothetical protein n=1 Tax=Nocardioides sp. SYSU DS0651 TaxID=3415955 RepID=UPI003F4B7948